MEEIQKLWFVILLNGNFHICVLTLFIFLELMNEFTGSHKGYLKHHTDTHTRIKGDKSPKPFSFFDEKNMKNSPGKDFPALSSALLLCLETKQTPLTTILEDNRLQ